MWIKKLLSPLVVCFVLSVAHAVSAQTSYVRITANGVNIRAGPATSTPVVAKAWMGDVFEFHGREAGWYRVKLFSRDFRYVHRSLAAPTPYAPSAPRAVPVRREIFRAFLEAEDRAETEADRKYPVKDRLGRPISDNVMKNLEWMWILYDRYKLEAVHRFKAEPPIHDQIIREGVEKGW